jgi:phospholipase C
MASAPSRFPFLPVLASATQPARSLATGHQADRRLIGYRKDARMRRPARTLTLTAAAGIFAAMAFGVTGAIASGAAPAAHQDSGGGTTTPIKHLVVIFDENISFDHYFGTYPYAANPAGEPSFTAKRGTPTVNGLYNDVTASGQPTGPLLTSNPNLSNPERLGHSDPMTCDQDHNYKDEQSADDHGAMDMFVQDTGRGTTLANCLAGQSFNGSAEPVPADAATNFAVMDYYDGNTVTGLWNLAQKFSMSDNSYTTGFGPSTPGALNVASAQTYGATCGPTSATINDNPCAAPTGLNTADPASTTAITIPPSEAAGPGTNYSDADPTYDICTYLPSSDGGDGRAANATVTMGGPNIGTELDSAGVSWGWFEGGFDNGFVPGHGTAPTTAQICNERHANVGGSSVVDYIPHHQPFQYYAATANPMHLPPTSVAMIGKQDQANHQYDTADFWAAANSGHLPQVSFLKAPAYQDGHAGYSDPNDEQTWIADTIDHLEALPSWSSTAVVINYDDSDGWYDHVLGPITTASQTSLDTLTGAGQCGTQPVPLNSASAPEQGRCGVGLRVPLLVVSPWSKSNFVDNTFTDQSSVVKFIEQNWQLPALGNGAADSDAGSLMSMFDFGSQNAQGNQDQPPNGRLFLDPTTGEPIGFASWLAHFASS